MSDVPRWSAVWAFLAGAGLMISVAAGPLGSLVGAEAELMRAVNELRGTRHLEPLQARPDLAEVARRHALDMAQGGYLSHVNPRGEDPLMRVRAAGIEGFRLLGENIAASSEPMDRIARVLSEWMASHAHRENLLTPASTAPGLAAVAAPDGRLFIVQLYATF
ncbi:MAG: CAP domain-containing protein [Myxococcota bacterium]